jgi:sec-independent protein translocase protein TatC
VDGSRYTRSTPDEKAYNRETDYDSVMADPASPGDDDDVDAREDGASGSDAGGEATPEETRAEETPEEETPEEETPEEETPGQETPERSHPPRRARGPGDETDGVAGGKDGVESLEDINEVGPARADALREAGFESVADVRAATADELTAASGVGGQLARHIKRNVDSAGDADGTDSTEDGDADGTDSTEDGDADGTGSGEGADDGSEDDLARVDDDTRDETGGAVEPVQADDGGLLGYGQAGGPDADEEMPLTEHIEEMLKRLVVVAVVAGVVSLVTFPFTDVIVNFLWNSILPAGPDSEFARPRLYSVLEFWFTKVKVASLAGVIIALPVLVYQTYRFMRPGLYPNERRYYLAAVPTSLVLALVGVAFAYFIVLPSVFTYFLYYSQDVTTIGFALGRVFDLILIMMAYLAVVFQIPLFILLAMMMGLVTRQWLADRRLLFWGAFLGISFLFSPDPTGMVPIMITLTMIALFEGTLLLTKWTRRRGGGKERGVSA